MAATLDERSKWKIGCCSERSRSDCGTRLKAITIATALSATAVLYTTQSWKFERHAGSQGHDLELYRIRRASDKISTEWHLKNKPQCSHAMEIICTNRAPALGKSPRKSR